MMWDEVERIRLVGSGQIFKHLSVYPADELVLYSVGFKVTFKGFKQGSGMMRLIF